MNTTGKTLLIKKCSDPQYWYADLVGTHVPFIREDAFGYVSREPAGYTNFVRRDDAVIQNNEGAACCN
ncbi:hypothetical protein [uncultured Gilvimarinus sp.]|uniref:hypothetical protein n=1 Tax=uncultured Gilvimarinus sp. TaxID=1689143 RepID=UPI0030D8D06B